MTLYVTPEKYRTMGFGIDLNDPDDPIEDFELASILHRAGDIAEGYLSVSQLPTEHGLFGGTVIDEEHRWRIPTTDFDLGQRRVYLFRWPVRQIIQFRIYVTNTQYVEIAPSELFINNSERYIEVISLAFTGVGLFGAIIPSLGLMQPVARVSYTYGLEEAVTDERLYPTDARTYRAANQFWKSDPAPVVKVNGSLQSSGFSIDYTEGTVIFDSPLATGSTVDVSYSYRLPSKFTHAIGLIATRLLGERELQRRGMEGVKSIRVGEVAIAKDDQRLSADNLAEVLPEAALLLDGFRQITVRG